MKSNRSRGFTYIECLVALAMAGVLMVIALPRFLRAQTHARQSEAITHLKSLHTAMMTQQNKPSNIHVYNFDPPRGNRYSYHLDHGCHTTENRSNQDAVKHSGDVCVGVDNFAYMMFPRTFTPVRVVNPVWSQRDAGNGMGASAGIFGTCGYPDSWDYLAYAAGDTDFEGTEDYEHLWDSADTWLISSADGQLHRVCPATTSPVSAPAGEPFMVYDDAACN
ncbi:prepilin-type N-terminal cleavage/methylation domain-containing protein [Hyalangium minutum]|uniref:Pilin n=1 Tax=Hyalangium minutum TaxID=394096 RepID=A0A085WL80_9BACT|nr:prepilin-type N-terminal cleavage/methylation domain-containing protein [Hyalangium minutum]KFE68443.1 pilin [Hyalangium minutum]